MSLFDEELNIAASDMLPTMADNVFVNGALIRGIVNDDQYEDDVGIRREISVSFLYENAPAINVKANVIFNNIHYVVRKLPDPNKEDPFYTVELRLA